MAPKKIILRCDSSENIGTGHVMRCLSLAEKLRNHEVIFVTRDFAININKTIKERQFKLLTLPPPKSPIDSWLGVPPEKELTEFTEILRQERPSWVIADHYGLNQTWEQESLKFAPNLLIIDDLFREHSATHLLDQNFHLNHTEQWKSKLSADCKTFLGPRYALLSQDFLNLFPGKLKQGDVKKVIAFFGGSDVAMGSELFIKAWENAGIHTAKALLVIGKVNSRSNALLSKHVKNLDITFSSSEFSKWLKEADLFVGAGGTTTWERCALGTPGLIISIAQNQEAIASDLHLSGIQEYLGSIEQVTATSLSENLKRICQDHDLRKKFSQKSLDLKVGSSISELIAIFD